MNVQLTLLKEIEEIDNDLVIRVPSSEKVGLIAFKGQTKKTVTL